MGALVGTAGARLGYPVCDAVASLCICFFIEKAAYDIFKDAIDKMVDKACDENLEGQIQSIDGLRIKSGYPFKYPLDLHVP